MNRVIDCDGDTIRERVRAAESSVPAVQVFQHGLNYRLR